jgi:hypothetical protein
MRVEVNDILHVLAHELRTPVGIAHGYVRLLLDERLPSDADRKRALEQMQKALGRLTDLSHETTSLAAWYEQDREQQQCIDARVLIGCVADADYDWPVTVDTANLPDGVLVRTPDGDALARALIGLVRATARELRGTTCDVVAGVDAAHFDMFVGPEEKLEALRRGPTDPDAGPVALERGGLGLALVHAAIVLDAHAAECWTMGGSRQTVGVRLPLGERPIL